MSCHIRCSVLILLYSILANRLKQKTHFLIYILIQQYLKLGIIAQDNIYRISTELHTKQKPVRAL